MPTNLQTAIKRRIHHYMADPRHVLLTSFNENPCQSLAYQKALLSRTPPEIGGFQRCMATVGMRVLSFSWPPVRVRPGQQKRPTPPSARPIVNNFLGVHSPFQHGSPFYSLSRCFECGQDGSTHIRRTSVGSSFCSTGCETAAQKDETKHAEGAAMGAAAIRPRLIQENHHCFGRRGTRYRQPTPGSRPHDTCVINRPQRTPRGAHSSHRSCNPSHRLLGEPSCKHLPAAPSARHRDVAWPGRLSS